jgi:hypothetical protein
MDVHIVCPAEERLVSLVKPFDGIIGDDFGTHIRSRFALNELVGLLDSVRDMEYIIDTSEFRIVYLNPTREDFRSNSHEWVLIISELVVSLVIVEIGREERVALERASRTASFTEADTHPWPRFSQRAKSPVRKRQRPGQ